MEDDSFVPRSLETMIEEFRKEAPDTSRDNVGAITTLLWSSVLGFTLLRPLLQNAFDWGDENDRALRDQLARAMVGLTGSK